MKYIELPTVDQINLHKNEASYWEITHDGVTYLVQDMLTGDCELEHTVHSSCPNKDASYIEVLETYSPSTWCTIVNGAQKHATQQRINSYTLWHLRTVLSDDRLETERERQADIREERRTKGPRSQ